MAAACDDEAGRDPRTKLHCPRPDCLVAHVDGATRQHLFNIAQAEREAEIEPDSVLDHGWRKAVPLVRNSRHWGPRKANSHGPHRRLGSIGLTAR